MGVFNPFRIGSIRHQEDRVTYAFACVMHQAGSDGLLNLLQTLEARVGTWNIHNWHNERNKFPVQLQVPGCGSKPDAGFEVTGHLYVLFENKSPNAILKKKQIEKHLKLLKDRYGQKVMLGITHFSNPPVWWQELQVQHPSIHFIYGSWRRVTNWARDYAQRAETSPVTCYLLEQLVEYVPTPVITPPAWLEPFYRRLHNAGQAGISYSQLDFAMLQAGSGLASILRLLEDYLEDVGGLYNTVLRSKRMHDEWLFTLHEDFLRGTKTFNDLVRWLNLS